MAKKKMATKRKAVSKKRVVKKVAKATRKPAAKKRVAKKKVVKKRVVKKSGVKRKSVLSQTPYTLSEELASVVGTKRATRPEIVKKLWVYIKANKLQDVANRRMIVPDVKLGLVIGKRPVDMLKLAGYLNKHIK